MKPYLYTVVDEAKLRDMLETFHGCMNIPIQVLDENGRILQSCGKTSAFCALFQKQLPKGDTCVIQHARAGQKAMELGEPYIFECHASLNHIIFPLINRQTLFGSILVGPFLMDEPDSVLISDIARHYAIPTETLLEMYDESGNLPVVPPARVTHLSHLLYYLFFSLISDGKEQLLTNQKILHQQSRISESIQMYKTSGAPSESAYPYDKEKELITRVKTGNTAEAKALLNDLLGYVFFSEGSNLETIKSRAIELCSLLSRAAIEGGATSDRILKINNQFLKDLQSIRNLDELCYKLQDSIDIFAESMFEYIPTKNSELMKKALSYISRNFASPITLEDVAKQVHLNPAYFSSIFKQSIGSSFKEYLNMVRIEESKRLLANTDYSVIDIAIATGFEDQSYFSKVFKKYTGLTPKQYR
ncbi:MAG TPA: PocR ligand-binding domain-containing protein [Candidatus Egerieimonas faecigallinarum]|nr:PocR ligand-binding domain-containing protein [Candidatus Egerieimonas faecigallinarum]